MLQECTMEEECINPQLKATYPTSAQHLSQFIFMTTIVTSEAAQKDSVKKVVIGANADSPR
jgi:hypothetical protein